ncbi:MAG: GxxExxY protein [Bacteroidales bacterium]|nr:GxxExxY protein [Bacteroidales bacterium]
MDYLYNDKPVLHKDLTEQIIECFYTVYNTLGYGFLENVYQNALYFELTKNGFNCETQKDIKVYYANRCVGNYRADIVVNDLIILELKAAEELSMAHATQLLNYLKATKYEVGLLLNFGKKAEIRRRIFENKYK